MLGDVCLPPAKRCFKVTDAGFALSNGEQDGNALGGGNGGQRYGDLFRDLGEVLVLHIRNPEYIIQLIQPCEYDNSHFFVLIYILAV